MLLGVVLSLNPAFETIIQTLFYVLRVVFLDGIKQRRPKSKIATDY